MAANSLLYLLLSTQLTTTPEQAVTTESNYGVSARQPYDVTEDPAQWSYDWRNKDHAKPARSWWQEPEPETDNPRDQFTRDPPVISSFSTRQPYDVTEDHDEWHYNRRNQDDGKPARSWWQEPRPETENPWDQYTAPPVTEGDSTRQPYDVTEDHDEWNYNRRNQDDGKPARSWWQEPRPETENPWDQYTAPPVTEETSRDCGANEKWDNCTAHCQRNCTTKDWPGLPCLLICQPGCICQEGFVRGPRGDCIAEDDCSENSPTEEIPLATEEPEHETESSYWQHSTEEPEYQTQSIFWHHATEEPEDETESIYYHQETEEPEHETESELLEWPRATEEPEDETETPRSEMKSKGRKCQAREHKSRFNCEKTCDNYEEKTRCKPKKGCVCDGGLVRNKENKCVRRDQCPDKQRAEEDDDSHGCPSLAFMCDYHCVRSGKKNGRCLGNICKCRKYYKKKMD